MSNKETLKTVGVAAASSAAMFMLSTLFLHRGETHGTIKFDPKARTAGRIGTWLLSGMRPREWVAVHRKHHRLEDQLGDPHSPVMNGRFGVLKVLFGNAFMYRRAVRDLQPEEYPPEIPQDKWDKRLLDKGWAGQLTLLGIFTAIHKGKVKRGLTTLALHDVGAVMAGGVINSLAHSGSEPLNRSLLHAPQPNENGTYTRNLGTLGGALTFGEGFHQIHHENPGRLVLHDNPFLDLGGAAGRILIKVGLASEGQRRT